MLSNKLKRIISGNQVDLYGLKGNILSAAKGKEVKTIFITSSRHSEGKTTAAIAIAHSLATAGNSKVLLVDANLRAPKVHELFEVQNAPGLTDLLLSRAGEDEALKSTEYERLTVLPCGSGGQEAGGALRPETLASGLASLTSKFDYVVCDGDSVLGSSDAAIVAKHFDGVMFVIECEKTKWEVLSVAKEKLLNVGGIVLGVVMNKRRYYIPRGLYAKI